METLLDVLKEIDGKIDWENEKKLIDDRIIDSFEVISLISELEDNFDIEIEAEEIIPENLNSVESIWKMVQRLQEN